MLRVVISDASPLHYLILIGNAEVLRALYTADRGSDQCSIPNAQFSVEVDVGLPVIRPMQVKIAPESCGLPRFG